jgi:apolipoprotein N-acyltransferase
MSHQIQSLVDNLLPWLMSLVFALAVSLNFLNHYYYLLTWFAFVPFLFALDSINNNGSVWATYALGLFAGLVLFASGTYWVYDFIVISKGYSAPVSLLLSLVYWLYCAHMIVVIALLHRYLRRSIHLIWVFPVIVSVVLAFYPMVFTLHLAESQVNFTTALQAIDYTGVHGLNFIIVLFNVLVFFALRRLFALLVTSNTANSLQATRVSYLSASLLLVSWFIYGFVSTEHWQDKLADAKTLKLGIIQPNEVPILGRSQAYAGYSKGFPPSMDMSQRLSQLGLDLIVWPEGQYKAYYDNQNLKQAYQHNVKKMATPLIFQDFENIIDPVNGESRAQYNSVAYINENGEHTVSYRKIKRILFGEYLPSGWLGELLKPFTGEFLNEISAGNEYQIIEHPKMRILPLICYETTFVEFVANAVNQANEVPRNNKPNVIVALSNDGWFGSIHQAKQHILASTLRAIETRTPLVHVANNGSSVLVSAAGEIVYQTPFGEAGGFAASLPYTENQSRSFYSQYPFLVKYFSLFILSVLLINRLRNDN